MRYLFAVIVKILNTEVSSLDFLWTFIDCGFRMARLRFSHMRGCIEDLYGFTNLLDTQCLKYKKRERGSTRELDRKRMYSA